MVEKISMVINHVIDYKGIKLGVIAKKCGITHTTLKRIRDGNEGVAIGHYKTVLKFLGIEFLFQDQETLDYLIIAFSRDANIINNPEV